MIIFRTLSASGSKLNIRDSLVLCVLGAAFAFLSICNAQAQEHAETAGAETHPRIVLLPEARFMRPPVMEEIPGSERTVKTVAELAKGTLRYLEPAEVARMEKEDKSWRERVRRAPQSFWERMEIQYLRQDDGVIIAAIVESTSQETCSLLFDPALVERMEDIFGPELHVAVPTRFRLYIFPKLAGRVAEFAPAVLSDYRVSPHPVSPEVFEVSRDGVRAVGILDDRAVRPGI